MIALTEIDKVNDFRVPRDSSVKYYPGFCANLKCFEVICLRLQELQDNEIEIPMTWVDCYGNPVKVGGEIAACDHDGFQRIRMRVLRFISTRWKLIMVRRCMVFCSGCTITLALTQADLSEIMEHVGWARRHTAPYYLQLAKVLNHEGASGRLAASSAENVVASWQDVNQLKRFVCAFAASKQRKRPVQ